MCKFCWVLVVVLLLVSSALFTQFVIVGETVPASDGRTAIVLEPGERDMVLAEMRGFLVSVQAVTSAAVADDMDAVVAAARKSGMPPRDQIPASLVRKLPLSFKTMGFGTHRAFDQLALDAEQLGDRDHTLEQLGDLMKTCVACHETYRLETAKDQP